MTRENAAQIEPERLKFIEHEAQKLAEEVRVEVQQSTPLSADVSRMLSRMLVAPSPSSRLREAVR